MLSIQNLSSASQAAHYYERDDYYLGDRERSPSEWLGDGAQLLGLSSPVDRAVFTKLLDGELPDGTLLPRRPDEKRRPGFDLTFSAPKSVSIAALVHGDQRVVSAHEDAVKKALGYLETHATFARIKGPDGAFEPVPTRNLVVAAFLHDTSRELDPQLHSHAVVLNATNTLDGWRAVTNEELLRSKMVGGAIYRLELARNLRAHGYQIRKTHADGRFEIKGYADEQLEAFSRRRAQIEAVLAERGLESAEAAKIAALDTRQPKRDVEKVQLRDAWRSRAVEVGLLARRPTQAAEDLNLGSEGRKAERAVAAAIEHLSERRSVFFEREVIAKAAGFALGGACLEDIDNEIRGALARGELLSARPSRESFGRRYTTRDALAREQSILATMALGQEQLRPILETHRLARRFDGEGLTRGQRDAVELVLATGDRFVGIQGYAGTGKTTVLSRIKALAEEEGLVVRGFAVTKAAANVLSENGIESTTLADHLGRERPLPPTVAGAPRELWILDEASLLGTKDGLQFLRSAERQNARVVLVGDRAQLPAIEAGKPFAIMVDRGLRTATIQEIKRQRDLTLKRAVEATIRRDLDGALLELEPSIREIANKADRLQAVAAAYLDLPDSDRRNTIVLTASNQDRRAINDAIRKGLEEERQLSGPAVSARVFVKKDLSKAERRDVASYGAGDLLRFGRAYKSIGIEKGEYAEVLATDEESNRLEIKTSNGRRIRFSPHKAALIELYGAEDRSLRAGDQIRFTRNDHERGRANGAEARVVAIDPSRVRATIERNGRREILDLEREGHWDHGYVRTIYGAQGRTADRAILHIDAHDRKITGIESWYVGISRARDSVRIFTDDAKQLPNVIKKSLAQEAAIETVTPAPNPEPTITRTRTPARRLERGLGDAG
jgi:conjugative relaxase-like TrwC/TraI family protein